MQDVDVRFKLVGEWNSTAKYWPNSVFEYMQEKPASSELKIFGGLFLGYQVIKEVMCSPQPPEHLRVTLHFENATIMRPTTEHTIYIVVKFYKERGATVRYKQETPDPSDLHVIPHPYIGKEMLEKVFGKGTWPEHLGITVHF